MNKVGPRLVGFIGVSCASSALLLLSVAHTFSSEVVLVFCSVLLGASFHAIYLGAIKAMEAGEPSETKNGSINGAGDASAGVFALLGVVQDLA